MNICVLRQNNSKIKLWIAYQKIYERWLQEYTQNCQYYLPFEEKILTHTQWSKVAIFSYSVVAKEPISSRTKIKFNSRKCTQKLQHNQTLYYFRVLNWEKAVTKKNS